MVDVHPQLVFFTELEVEPLARLLARPGLVETLSRRGYGLSMGMLDFSTQRAALVRKLAEQGVELTARLLLPRDEGYWFNVDNYPQAIDQYHRFREWASEHELDFDAVGLDIEPSLQHWAETRRLRSLATIVTRVAEAHQNALYPAARDAYLELVGEIRSDGYEIHTYQYPFVVDDRRAATTLVQRTLNVVDLPADVEVLMCYSSIVPGHIFGSDLGGALVAAYGSHADSLGIGSTGGGVVLDTETGERAPRLSWNAFARDLRIAASFTDLIHVFSLEGCVDSGYFECLDTFDWSPPARIPLRYRAIMGIIRSGIGTVLWWSRFGLTVLGWLGWVVAGAMMIRRAYERRRRSR